MERVDLIKTHELPNIGDNCQYKRPNVINDTIFYAEGKPVGFFLRKMPDVACKLADIVNKEFRSKNVPKSEMDRIQTQGFDEKTGKGIYKRVVQYSTIIGSVAPKPHMRRPYPTISSVHSKKSTQTFIKAMFLLAVEAERIIQNILPEQYALQEKLFEDVPDKWKFGNLFTSAICNYNIPAPFHRDTANIIGAVNVIITKRLNSKGGNLHIPAYDATIDQCDNSILVYPAWRDVHGVTPIEPTFKDGYRNSLVLYPLKAFKGLKD